jgi:predicted O-methyltransferase YrrM
MPLYQPDSARGWIVGTTFNGSLNSWRVSRTLKRMEAAPEAAGHSDKGVQNLLFSLTVSLRPRRVLEIGTHIGTGAVVIGHALKRNGYGRLITLEPASHYRRLASNHVQTARVADYVTIVGHFSYEEPCKEILRAEAPFELVFIDGAHDYESASHDIALCTELLCTNGIMVLHDVGVLSDSLDSTGRGGVRQALADFCDANPAFRAIFFEFPLWLNNTGAAIVAKQQLDPPVRRRLGDSDKDEGMPVVSKAASEAATIPANRVTA